MPEWNPHQYLKFVSERTQPSIDLASRINIENPKSIIDIGCGPGNSTQVLRDRWPEAKTVGLDSSERMIGKAKKDYPESEWIIADASTFTFERKYDIVFSNAAIQWMPGHESLILKFFQVVEDGGVLAVQVPADSESPLRQALLSVSSNPKWSRFTSGAEKLITYHSADYYYNILTSVSTKLEIWETVYYHILNSHTDLVEWYKGTGMRPFLEKIPDEASRKEFEDDVLVKCKASYEIQKDGKVLYPFRRIFFTAYK